MTTSRTAVTVSCRQKSVHRRKDISIRRDNVLLQQTICDNWVLSQSLWRLYSTGRFWHLPCAAARKIPHGVHTLVVADDSAETWLNEESWWVCEDLIQLLEYQGQDEGCVWLRFPALPCLFLCSSCRITEHHQLAWISAYSFRESSVGRKLSRDAMDQSEGV